MAKACGTMKIDLPVGQMSIFPGAAGRSDSGGLRGRFRRRCRDAPRPAAGGSCRGDMMLPGAAGRVTAADCEGGSIGPNEIGIVPS